jgi:cyclic pyranopterin phosphate synthase
MLASIRDRHELIAIEDDDPSSTSINFRFEISNLKSQSRARIGIIAPVTRPFCGACSRLRITADGKVRPCLFSLQEWDLKPILRADGVHHGDHRGLGAVIVQDAKPSPNDPRELRGQPQLETEVRRFLVDSMWSKQAGHGIGSTTFVQPPRTMSAIGG